MKQEVAISQQDYTVLILVRDSTTGAPKTALTYASAGIDVCYTRVETDNDVVLTAGAPVETTLTGAHVDWGFVKVDDTNAPGLYKLDIADGVFATGAWSAVVSFICTGCDPVHIEFVLVPEVPLDGVKTKSITDGAVTAAAVADGAIDNAALAADIGSTAYDSNIIALAVRKVLDELNLDHLAKVATAAADMTTEVTDATIISRMLSKTSDTSSFDPTTDSLEAIRDKETDIETDTAVIGALGAGLTALAQASVCTEARLSELDAGTGGKAANVIDVIAVDVAGLDGAAMRGTDSAALASVCTEARLSELDAGTGGKMANDVTEILTDTGTTLQGELDGIQTDTENIQTRIPDALVGGFLKADVYAINASTAAAARLALSAGQIIPGTVDTGSFAATTTAFESDDIVEATADHYNGRMIIFTSGALIGQATEITDYALAGANGHFTVTALTEAPGNDVTFIIV